MAQDDLLQNQNVRKFLDLIAKAEGSDYDTIVGGKHKLSDFSQHPAFAAVKTKEGPSTAAGRYQIVKSTWDPYAKKLGLNDFSPRNQDRVAIEIIKDSGALDDVLKGDYQRAVGKLGNQWASLPSSPYTQSKRSDEWIQTELNKPMGQNSEWSVASKAPVGSTPVSLGGEWSVANKAPLTQEAPPKQEAPVQQPKEPEKKKQDTGWSLKNVDDVVRAAANGLTFGWADRLAAAGSPGSYEANIKKERQLSKDAQERNPILYPTTEFGSSFLLPAGTVAKGASMASKVGNASKTGALYGALTGSGMESGDTNLAQAGKNTVTGAGTGAAVGAALTPVVSKGLEAVSKISPYVDKQLTAGAINRNFKDNPNAQMDVELITDLASQRNGKGGRLKADDLRALGNSYLNQLDMLLKQSGLSSDEASFAIKNWKAMGADSAQPIVQKLQQTEEGRIALATIDKAKRLDNITSEQEATKGFGRLVRGAVDSGLVDAGLIQMTGIPLPLATAARNQIKRFSGAQKTRAEVTNDTLLDPRNLKAAEELAPVLGPTESAQGMGILRDKVEQAAAKDAERKAAAEADKGILAKVMEEKGIKNRSGVLMNFENGLGLSQPEMDKVLTGLAEQHPDLKPIIDKLYTPWASFDKQSFDSIQRLIENASGKTYAPPTPIGQAMAGGAAKGNSKASAAVYGLTDEQAAQLMNGRSTDAVGNPIASNKAWLSQTADRLLSADPATWRPQDIELLKALGLQ